MFGTNAIVKASSFAPDVYKVQEAFYTLQGEGPLAGLPAYFVRMRGCNLRCHFCDTDFESGTRDLSLEELLDDIDLNKSKSRCVVITGGEPMLQNLGPLCYAIISRFGLQVQIETAGTVWPESFDDPIIEQLIRDRSIFLVCSPKTGSVHPQVEAQCTDWKYIISAQDTLSEIDGLPVSSTQIKGARVPVFRPRHTVIIGGTVYATCVWVQPCDEYAVSRGYDIDEETGRGASKVIAFQRDNDWCHESTRVCASIALQFGYRMCIQMHKAVGLP